MPLIEIKGLKTYFYTEGGVVHAVDGVDLTVEPEKTLGIVGESGCGKSVTALSILRLIPTPPGKIVAGEILFHRNGEVLDLAKINPRGSQMRSIRGNEIAMIFQEPMTSLNPVHTIGKQIMESIIQHQNLNKRAARKKAIAKLDDGLDKDIAKVQEQLRKDCNKPGAKKADLEAAADAAIVALKADHDETTSAL